MISTITENLSKLFSIKADFKSTFETQSVETTGLGLADYPDTIWEMPLMAKELVEGTIVNATGDLNGYTMRSSAFFMCNQLKTVSLTNIGRIGSSAFMQCSALTDVYIGESSTQGRLLGENIFYSCSNLTNVTTTFRQTGNGMFEYCSRLSNLVTEECTVINQRVFYSCYALSNISFPKVTLIYEQAFQNCSNLTTVSFPQCTTIFNSAATNPSQSGAFQRCPNLTNASFPECAEIGSYTFGLWGVPTYYCANLTTISFPKCVTIGNQAFAWCVSLTEANFPSCTTIGDAAFHGCLNMTSASFPLCTTIGTKAFGNHWDSTATSLISTGKLTTAYFPKCGSVPEGAFSGQSLLTSITLSNIVRTVGPAAFDGCSALSTITISGCNTIGYWAFKNCRGLMSIYLNQSNCQLVSGPAPSYAKQWFENTPMTDSTITGTFGSIYVPAMFVDFYRDAWTSGTGIASERFVAHFPPSADEVVPEEEL